MRKTLNSHQECVLGGVLTLHKSAFMIVVFNVVLTLFYTGGGGEGVGGGQYAPFQFFQ